MPFRTLGSINDVWVYDNPDTMKRELFRNGHLIIHFPEVAFEFDGYYYKWYPHGENKYIEEMYIEDMRELGPFDEGHEWGDRIHKPYDPLATELWSE